MMKQNISALLKGNPYPGRGIIIGRSHDSKKAIITYFIMGRSENSRNRVFVETEDGIKTQAHDPRKLTDPSLVIYHPVRRVETGDGFVFIVTNGDQTETIRDHLKEGKSYLEALMTRTFEPDPPIYTPRISGILFPCGSYMLSILKPTDSSACCCARMFFTYDTPQPGTGHFIHTYKSDGGPPPLFDGEPTHVAIDCGYRDFAELVWESLNRENKVALYACETDIITGKHESIIFNKL